MLVLKRCVGEKIIIGDGLIVVTLVEGRQGAARIGVDAPKDIEVHREEIWKEIQAERKRKEGES